MNDKSKLLKHLFCIHLVLFSGPVFAYLDPGTGSMIVQGLLAAVAATFVGVNHYWEKLKSFFRKEKEEKSDTRPD